MMSADAAKTTADGASIAIVLGWLANILPGIATGLTIIWMLIRIWETDTVKGWREKFRNRKRS